MERISFFRPLENFTVRFFFIDSERHEIASEMGKRKKKDAFKEFRCSTQRLKDEKKAHPSDAKEFC